MEMDDILDMEKCFLRSGLVHFFKKYITSYEVLMCSHKNGRIFSELAYLV